MSSNLVWEPADRKNHSLPYELKFAMRKHYGEPIDKILTDLEAPYLEGLRDAGISGAQILLDAIEKHDKIHVREEY